MYCSKTKICTITVVLIAFLSSCSSVIPFHIVSSPNPTAEVTEVPSEEPTAAPTAVPTSTPIPEEREGLTALKNTIENRVSGVNGDLGIYIKNLNTNEFLSINEHEMYSASLIKLFIMASVYDEINKGNITKDKNISELLDLMITESDNNSANELCEILGNGDMLAGFEKENANTKNLDCTYTIQQTDLQDDRSNSTIPYIGRNYTSPRDCGHLLELIYRGKLCNSEYSTEMLDLLKRQQTLYKIPMLLPEGTVTANKTGEMSGVENDTAIVYSSGCDYIISIMGNNGDSDDLIEVIQDISLDTYSYFNE